MITQNLLTSRFLMEEMEFDFGTDNNENEYTDWDEWIYELYDDMDLITFLYSDLLILTPDDTYHFDNWFKQQFYVPETEEEEFKKNI